MNTDVLEKAKQGILPLNKMQTYTKNYLQAGGTQAFSNYYSTDSRFAYFNPSLLQNIIFAQHNLVTDQSFNEFHIILCRNVLIYFTSKLQNQVQQLFYESLGHNGFLCLGIKKLFVSRISCRIIRNLIHTNRSIKNTIKAYEILYLDFIRFYFAFACIMIRHISSDCASFCSSL